MALLENLREKVGTVFERHGPTDTLEQLQDEVLATTDDFPDPFSTFITTYMQEKINKFKNQELFNPVQPEEVIIS